MLSMNELKVLVEEVIALGNELRAFHGHDDTPAQQGPAPSARSLAVFNERFSNSVPPSYLRLMSVFDGIENFEWVDVSILSTEFLLNHSDLEESWVEAGACEPGDLFIFAQSDTDAHVVAFLLKTGRADGDMRVIRLDASGPLQEHEGFEAYLRDRRDWFAKYVAQEKADRQELKSDE